MINAGILDGDLVLVEQSSVADNGDIVVALLDDSATVKRFYKRRRHLPPPAGKRCTGTNYRP